MNEISKITKKKMIDLQQYLNPQMRQDLYYKNEETYPVLMRGFELEECKQYI